MSYPPPDPFQPQPQVPVVPSAPPASPGPYGHPYPPVVMAVSPPTSGWAIGSLIMGIIGVLGGFCLMGIPCIAAVICGHAGLIDTRNNAKSGRGLAVAGLIMGYLFVVPAIAVFVMGGIGSVLPGGSTAP